MKKILALTFIAISMVFLGCNLDTGTQNTQGSAGNTTGANNTGNIDTSVVTGGGTGIPYGQEVFLPFFNNFESASLNGLQVYDNEWKITRDTDGNGVVVPNIADINSDMYLFADFKTNFTLELKFKRKISPCWMVFDLAQQNVVGAGLNNWLIVEANIQNSFRN